MLPTTLEFIADESDAVEIHAHSELFVFRLYLPTAGTLLGDCLMVQRQRQGYVSPNLTGVQFAVESPKLHRTAAVEEAVQIQEVIAAVVVAL